MALFSRVSDSFPYSTHLSSGSKMLYPLPRPGLNTSEASRRSKLRTLGMSHDTNNPLEGHCLWPILALLKELQEGSNKVTKRCSEPIADDESMRVKHDSTSRLISWRLAPGNQGAISVSRSTSRCELEPNLESDFLPFYQNLYLLGFHHRHMLFAMQIFRTLLKRDLPQALLAVESLGLAIRVNEPNPVL